MATGFERTIARNGQASLEVKKSRFIGQAFRVSNEVDARAEIERVRKDHWNANHNCTAWRIGPQGRYQRTSDDGEPAGTAGVPMLDVLNHRELTDVLVVVTRFFGGVKLGAGGLIRAYGSAVSAVIGEVGIVERRPLHEIAVTIDHADSGRFEHYLRTTDFPLSHTGYTADGVEHIVHIEPESMDAYFAMVAEQTAGKYIPREVGVRIVEVAVSQSG